MTLSLQLLNFGTSSALANSRSQAEHGQVIHFPLTDRGRDLYKLYRIV
jgi:hypothetical protein